MDNSRRSSRCNRLFAAGTLDEDAPLVVNLVGDKDGSTAQIAFTERAPATIRRHIWHGEGESPGACDIPRDSICRCGESEIKDIGTAVKVNTLNVPEDEFIVRPFNCHSREERPEPFKQTVRST